MSYRLAVCALFALACAACEDDLETRPPAYPQEPIGYTTPPSEPPPAQAAAAPPQATPAGDESEGPPTAPEVGAAGEDIDSPQAPDGVVIDDGAGAPAPGAAPQGAPPEGPPPDDAQADGAAYGDADPSALSDFRPALDPYGSWVDDPNYGTVWVPSADVVGGDFSPYVTGGHWAYDDDYTWVSDYSWGWAPFHYGRWAYTGRGWGWIPGRRYSGAWVSWRTGTPGWDYVGWAPLAPTWCWHGGNAVGIGFAPRAPFAYVGRNDLFSPAVGRNIVRGPILHSVAVHAQPWRGAPVGGGYRLSSGPSPRVLGIPTSSVVHTTGVDRGVAEARAFARPTSAVALGARPPVATTGRAWQARGSTTLTGAPAAAPSHFGGRFGVGFSGNAYAAPVRIGPSYSAPPAYGAAVRPAQGAYPLGASRGPVRTGSPYGYRGPVAMPQGRGMPAGVMRTAPPTGGVHYAPSAPSVSPRSSPSGGFHGGGSYGGSRGGGGRGGGHR
jgi:hypothetical protein